MLADLPCEKPGGAFYLFPDIRPVLNSGESAEQFAAAITFPAADGRISRFLSGFSEVRRKNAVHRGARDTTIAPTATPIGSRLG